MRRREIDDEAIVVRTYRTGEADRISVLFTKHHGKVRVLARGARKSTTRIGVPLEPVTWCRVDLVASRGNFHIARSVRLVEPLLTLHASYDRMTAALAIVEALDALPGEDVPNAEVYEVAARVLRSLDNQEFYPHLVPAAFFLRLLELDGSGPVTDACVACGATTALVAFDAATGGVRCDQHRVGVGLSRDAVTLLQRMSGGDLAAVLREERPAGAHDVADVLVTAWEEHIGRRSRVLRTMTALPEAKETTS